MPNEYWADELIEPYLWHSRVARHDAGSKRVRSRKG
jgi:hypothetical protein